jgi:hypothetical protein
MVLERFFISDTCNRPANGEFTVELAVNRAFTTLSFKGRNTGLFVDGKAHPGLGLTTDGKFNGSDCISEPNSEQHLLNLVSDSYSNLL